MLKRSLFGIEPTAQCAPAYRFLYAPENDRAATARMRCENLWSDFQDLADPNFNSTFPIEFHQRWYEMYLGVALRLNGLDVRAPTPGRGPDFVVVHENRRIFIEAIAPKAGDPSRPDSVPEPAYWDGNGDPIASNVPHNQITLRITSAFAEKERKFETYCRAGLIEDSDARIIAINIREIPHAWVDAEEFWLRALYGVGDQYIEVDQSGNFVAQGRHHRSQIQKENGATVDVHALLNPQRAMISGVLGSSADVANLPIHLGDDFALMPHASALSPYPTGFLRVGVETVLRPDGNEWLRQTTDYGAHPFQGHDRMTIEYEGKRLEGDWSVEGRTLRVSLGGRASSCTIARTDEPLEVARRMIVEIAMTKYKQGTH